MKSLIPVSALALLMCSGILAHTGVAQAPGDFHLIATAGGENAFAENRAIEILPNGSLTFVRFIPSDIGGDPLEEYSTTLSQTQLNEIWQALQTQQFFAMDAEYREERIQDRTYARLAVTGNAATHDVRSANIAMPAFDAIMAAINGMMPAGKVLVYDITEPVEYVSHDICPSGKGAGDEALKSVIAKANLHVEDFISKMLAEVHAGTVIAHRLKLKEAVRRGIVKLEGKGGYFGDKVAIEADNSANQKTDTVTVRLYLEFYGANATEANVAKIKSGIEQHWSKKRTTGGKTLMVNVVTRRNTGAAPPATAGYHQIKVMGAGVSHVIGGGHSFNVNEGTGSGAFETTGFGDERLKAIYAHEAGHLMGLDDRYDNYEKQPDGRWKNTQDGTLHTTAALATAIAPRFPGQTAATLTAWMNQRGTTRVGPTQAGHENNLMATLSGSVQQSDIDALAQKANLLVEVRPGDVLVNKNGADQNLTVTRTTDLQVPVGGKKRIEGLYTACIDGHEGTPDFGQRYDVGPHLSEWTGMDAPGILLQLLEYVDANDLFCSASFTSQSTVWRITDNSNIGDPYVADMLTAAGIEIGERMLDFPRMSNPLSDDTTTALAIPLELINIETLPERVLTNQPSTLTFESVIHIPDVGPYTSRYSWSLIAPEGSSAELTDSTTAVASLTPDVRGLYMISLSVRLVIGGDTVTTDASSARVVYADSWTDTFERANLSDKFTFAWTTTEESPWILADDDVFSGTKAAKSADISDDGATAVEIAATLPEAGDVSFALRVSSESRYDKLVYSVDDVAHGEWSGDVPWTTASFPLDAGAHILRWEYTKDGSVSSGLDAAWLDDVFFPINASTVPVEGAAPGIPNLYRLEQSHPNPAREVATIRYSLPHPRTIRITVYDLVGREVSRLVDGNRPAGVHAVAFETSGLASGVYVYRMEAGDFLSVRKLVVLR